MKSSCPSFFILLILCTHLLEVFTQSVPPAGCTPVKGCDVQTKRKDNWYKVETCRYRNPRLVAPKDTTLRKSAAEVIITWSRLDLAQGSGVTLHKNNAFRLDKQGTFSRQVQGRSVNFANLQVQRNGETGRTSVAHVDVQLGMEGVTSNRYLECIQKGLYESLRSTQSVFLYQVVVKDPKYNRNNAKAHPSGQRIVNPGVPRTTPRPRKENSKRRGGGVVWG